MALMCLTLVIEIKEAAANPRHIQILLHLSAEARSLETVATKPGYLSKRFSPQFLTPSDQRCYGGRIICKTDEA